MRVLQVVHGYPPLKLGGTEIHTRAVAHELSARGHDVWVFAARPRDVASADRSDIDDGPIAVRWTDVSDRRVVDVSVRHRFEQLLDEVRPDVVHVQHLVNLSADLVEAARCRSVPTVVSLHDLWLQCCLIWPGARDRHPFTGRAWGLACVWHGIVRRPRTAASLLRRGRLPRALVDAIVGPAAKRRQLASADALLAPSTFIIDSFVRFGVPRERLRLLPHASDLEVRAIPQEIRRPVRFGFVGTLVREKGVDVLCRAFSGLGTDSTLSLHGQAPDPRYLRRIMRLLGPGMTYEGPFAPSDAAAVYDGIDVLVVPSVVAESFSLSAHEGHVRGLPVIASRIGALPERVTDQLDGLLVPPGDVEQLRAALSALGDPAAVRDLAANIQPPPSMADYIAKLQVVYAEVTARRNAGANARVAR